MHAFEFFPVCLLATLACATSVCEEGSCREEATGNGYQVCGSGIWQQMPAGAWFCESGRLTLPLVPATAATPSMFGGEQHSTSLSPPQSHRHPATSTGTSSSRLHHTAHASGLDHQGVEQPACVSPGDTGFSVCTGRTNACRNDSYGTATYTPGGKMASVYDAPPEGPFRCDISAPEDGLYVAFWTPYRQSLGSQSAPSTCGKRILLTNPATGVSREASVIDRCASCVGVGYQTDDPTTSDELVNGATIDLSRSLWNLLYDQAAATVYDIEYGGPAHGGWDTEPSPLTSPMCS